MKRFIAKIKNTCEWEVELGAEAYEDAEERLKMGDWDITRDMVLNSETTQIVELLEMDE